MGGEEVSRQKETAVQRGKLTQEIVNILARLKLYVRGEKWAAERCKGSVKR